MLSFYNEIKKVKKTFILHTIFSLLQGVLLGLVAMNEFVYLKAMNGSNLSLSVLLQLAVVVLLFSIISNEFFNRIKNKKKLLRITALVTHLPLLLFYFFPQYIDAYGQDSIYHYIFLGIFFFFYLNNILINPVTNLFLKQSYGNNFGLFYSFATSLNKLVMFFITLFFGFLLDINNYSFTYIYPIMGIVGIISIYILSNIDYIDETPDEKYNYWQTIKNSFSNTYIILKDNVNYRNFQIGFMFYGFAWMITAAIIVIYFKEVYDMNNKTFAFYKNGYNIISIIILPFLGKLLDKIDVKIFSALTFLSMLLYLFFLGISGYFPGYVEFYGIKLYYMLIIAYLFYSVFAATMALLWYIGSAYFCKPSETGQYQAIHLALTGLRGIFGFQLGIIIYTFFGFTFTFMLGVFLLLVAIIIMLWSYKKTALTSKKIKY